MVGVLGLGGNMRKEKGSFWEWASRGAALITLASAIITVVIFTQRCSFIEGETVEVYNEAELSHFIAYIERTVSIESCLITPKRIRPGESVNIDIIINNTGQYDKELWIGATAYGIDGISFSSVEQDKYVSLIPNNKLKATRSLGVPESAGPGEYYLHVNLWYGRKGNPGLSQRIDGIRMPAAFLVLP